ncbi:MAG: CBS domain-containing protein [Actinobacteria bacterium]|nr:CBS domain-containing protein [Actinomycetota bacterium]
MTRLADVMTTDVLTVSENATLSQVARALRSRNVGSAIVIDEQELAIGIISERELVDSVAGGRNPDQGTAQLWMRPELLTANVDTSAEEATEIMRANNVRHLPVSSDGKVVGVVSISDLLVGIPG